MTIPVNNFFSKSKPSSPTGSSFDTYKSLQQDKTSTSTLVEYHLNNILKAMRIKLKENQTFVNPYNPNVNEEIHPEIFIKFTALLETHVKNMVLSAQPPRGKKETNLIKWNLKTMKSGTIMLQNFITKNTTLSTITYSKHFHQNPQQKS